jgi:hypothetical protein
MEEYMHKQRAQNELGLLWKERVAVSILDI